MFFLLPLIAIGIAVLAGRHSQPVTSPPHVGAAPSPFVVLDGFVRAGKQPPPFVVQCAIAQAELAGRMDIVTDIVRTFIEPVVIAAEVSRAMPPMAPMAPMARMMPAEPRSSILEALAKAATVTAALAEAPEVSADPRAWTNDEAMVHAALETMQHPELGTQIIPGGDIASIPPPRAESPVVAVSGAFAMERAAEIESHRAMPPVDPYTPSRSPIQRLPAERFGDFARTLARESVAFDGPRHVGQFRARKDRLIELGIDPLLLPGDHDAQLDALCVDMADAFEHARASGMLRQHCRRTIDVGAKQGGVHTITASGILGVIQAAGLEGAADWLDNPSDRDRFPHTTAVFVRTNGVF